MTLLNILFFILYLKLNVEMYDMVKLYTYFKYKYVTSNSTRVLTWPIGAMVIVASLALVELNT